MNLESSALLVRRTDHRIRDLAATVVHVTGHTNWIVVRVETNAGGIGLGEATLDGSDRYVLACLDELRARFIDAPADDIERLCAPVPGAPEGLAYAAALSAVEQALWDLLGQALEAPVHRLLGGPCRDRVRLYANINRSLIGDRSPAAFARRAAAATASGFTAVKCAPFDGLYREPFEERHGRVCIREGLARVRAVREAIGDDIDLLIDCHFRFDARTAIRVIPELEAYDPYWIEAPVSERDLEGWATVRAATTARLAGGELLIGVPAFRRFLEASRVDVLMPDVKYVGGVAALKKVGALAEAYGAQVAPHNPSGPIATLASAQVAANLRNAVILEYAWGEADWRADLVQGTERIEDGYLCISEAPGIGAGWDPTLAAAHPPQFTTPTLDRRLW